MTTTLRDREVPLPQGFRVRLDATTNEVEPGVLVGGRPMSVLRLTEAGAHAWAELQAGPVSSRAAGRLGRRLTDAGLAHPEPSPAAGTAAVTVVIPVHGRAAQLDRCLAALGRRYPVVVVDDASPDAAAIASVARHHGAALLRLERNGGPAAARNAGVPAATTELIAFLDSDTVPHGDWISPLADHLQDPLVGAAAPRIVALQRDGLGAVRNALDLGGEPASVRPYGPVGHVPTAALLIRRSALAELDAGAGPFDPALRVGEDVDLVWRLLAADWRVRYEPSVCVAHDEPTSHISLLRRRFRYGTSAAPLGLRHPDSVAPLIIHPWYAGTVAALLAGRPATAAGAFVGAVLATRRAVMRAGLPPRRVLPATLRGVGQTWLGGGRYATQFATPLLLAATLTGRPRRRAAAVSLLAASAASQWRPGSRTHPASSIVGALADDIAYGAGVLYGCVAHGTLRPLRPRVLSAPIRRQSS